jgi:hypothetical protein
MCLGAEKIDLSAPIFIQVIFKSAVVNAQAGMLVTCNYDAPFPRLDWDSGYFE